MNTLGIWVGTVLGGILALSCNGAEWTGPQVAPNYHVPPQLNVGVVLKVNGEGLTETVDAMVEVMRTELADKGVRVTRASGTPSPPAAVLTITNWDPGSRAMRAIVGMGSGAGHMDVEVAVTDASGRTMLSGTIHAKLSSGLVGGSASGAGNEAGKSIAEAIATGKLE